MSFAPGIYEVISIVAIRREPRITATNWRGSLSVGTRRQVYSTITNLDNSTWGRVSESDAAGVALWICLQSINREYAKRIGDAPLSIGELTTRFLKLLAWAREQGFEE